VSISNNINRLEKIFDNININEKVEKTDKLPLIFVARVINIQSLYQLLEEISIGDYEIKIINKE